MDILDSDDRACIQYPCTWHFKIIGRDCQQLEELVTTLFAGERYDVTFSRHSAKKTYCSINLALWVQNASQRDQAFRSLKDDPQVVMVI